LAGIWTQRVFYAQARLAKAKQKPTGASEMMMAGTAAYNSPYSTAADSPDDSNIRRAGVNGQVLGRNYRTPGLQSLSNVRVWGGGTSGWAVASSKQSWLEATGAMYNSIMLLIGTTLAVTILLALSNLITALTDNGWNSGASWDYACRTCSDEVSGGPTTRDAIVAECMETGRTPLNLCFLSWHGRLVLPTLIGGQVVSLGLLTCFTLQAAWDPVAVEAGNATGQRWLSRWRVTHIVMAPCMMYVGFPIMGVQAMEFYWASRAVVETVGCSCFIVGVLQLCACVWVLQKGTNDIDDNTFPKDDATTPRPRSASLRRVLSLPKMVYKAFLHDSVSLHFTHIFMLTLLIHSFSFPEMSAYGTPTTITIILLRALGAAIFVLARDTPADFSDLKRDPNGAGFGLVVDACLLQEALRRYLENTSPIEHLPTYKATVYRMEACMAGRCIHISLYFCFPL
jgi:hypothetical protein